MNKYLVLFLSVILASSSVSAQEEGESPDDKFLEDFTYERLSIKERLPVPYPSQREADVMFARRIVRVMDTKEKQNLVCRWPVNPLAKIVFKGAEQGKFVAYKNEHLSDFYKADTVLARMQTSEVISVPDPYYPGEYIDSTVFSDFSYEEKVTRWQIVEDWIFDKQRGIFYPRVIALCPLRRLVVEGQDLGEEPAFCIAWNEARKLLITEQIFNRHNDAARFSYYDWFELRLFASYITKEPNVFDEAFSKYVELKDNPLAQLLESERAKEDLFNWEHDLWQY